PLLTLVRQYGVHRVTLPEAVPHPFHLTQVRRAIRGHSWSITRPRWRLNTACRLRCGRNGCSARARSRKSGESRKNISITFTKRLLDGSAVVCRSVQSCVTERHRAFSTQPSRRGRLWQDAAPVALDRACAGSSPGDLSFKV